MTSLRRLAGMPVVARGKLLGWVERATLTADGKRLLGLVIRHGLGGARWVPAGQILELGASSVLAQGAPQRPPKEAQQRLGTVYHAQGLCLGLVTDALLHPLRLTVLALEISYGPLYRLAGRSAYATEYSVRPAPPKAAADAAREVVVAELKNRQAVGALAGKEVGCQCR